MRVIMQKLNVIPIVLTHAPSLLTLKELTRPDVSSSSQRVDWKFQILGPGFCLVLFSLSEHLERGNGG